MYSITHNNTLLAYLKLILYIENNESSFIFLPYLNIYSAVEAIKKQKYESIEIHQGKISESNVLCTHFYYSLALLAEILLYLKITRLRYST